MKHPASPRAVALLALLLASTATADIGDLPRYSTFINVGPLLSMSTRPAGGTFAYGVEASLHHFLDKDFHTGIGLFAQFQGTNADHSRYCAGIQGTYEFGGLELGLTYENPSDDFAGTTSLHLAPFISAAGFATLAVRVGIPLSAASGPRPGHGMDLGLVLSLKFPLPLGGY
jgi:hypothetical protein